MQFVTRKRSPRSGSAGSEALRAAESARGVCMGCREPRPGTGRRESRVRCQPSLHSHVCCRDRHLFCPGRKRVWGWNPDIWVLTWLMLIILYLKRPLKVTSISYAFLPVMNKSLHAKLVTICPSGGDTTATVVTAETHQPPGIVLTSTVWSP